MSGRYADVNRKSSVIGVNVNDKTIRKRMGFGDPPGLQGASLLCPKFAGNHFCQM